MNPEPRQTESDRDNARRHMHELEDEMLRIKRRLDEEPDLLDSKVQGLHRVFLSYISHFGSMWDKLASRAKAYSDEPENQAPGLPDAWKADVEIFTREAFDITLYDHQKRLCTSHKKTAILIAGRGAGKSQAAIVAALHDAVSREHQTVLIVSSTQRMSSEFGSRIIHLIGECAPIKRMAQAMSSREIRFGNGSAIKCLPPNPSTIRGYHPKRGGAGGVSVVLDEACFMERGGEVLTAVEYALITVPRDHGRLLIVSSPSAATSWVHALVKRAEAPDSDIESIHCASAANPLISTETIEALRREKNEHEFRAEVMGEWVEGGCGLFARYIDACRVTDDQLPGDAVFALGADLALSYSPNHDRSVLAVAARWQAPGEAEPRYRLVEIAALEAVSDADIRRAAEGLIDRWGVDDAVIEQYQGKSLAEHCQSMGLAVELAAPTATRQRGLFHRMVGLMRDGRLELADDLPSLFFDELAAFEYRRSASGGEQFGHPLSGCVHDDTVYAAAWALEALFSEDERETPAPRPQIAFMKQK